MFKYLFNRKIFDQKIFFNKYRLSVQKFSQVLNLRIILGVLFLLFLLFILRIWGESFLCAEMKK
jgi:hypothetical protein